MEEVDAAYLDKFTAARRAYNACVVEYQISRVFDMYNSEYSYNLLKSVIASFESLSEEEKALVSNASVLDTKKAELAEKMGKTLDFNLSYSDYFPVAEDDGNNGTPDANNGWVTILIVGVSVIALAAAAAVVLLLLKKKNAIKVTESSDGE